jgi:hypothetical protein
MVEADCYWCLSKLLDGIQVSVLCACLFLLLDYI